MLSDSSILGAHNTAEQGGTIPQHFRAIRGQASATSRMLTESALTVTKKSCLRHVQLWHFAILYSCPQLGNIASRVSAIGMPPLQGSSRLQGSGKEYREDMAKLI